MAAETLVSTTWLHEQMKLEGWNEKYCLLDATWDLPKSKRNFVQEYEQCHIPGAKYFSLSECRNKEASLPNTIPTLKYFESFASRLGVTNYHHVILYDNSERFGLFSAPRAWWLFQVFSHTKVSILDGGLPKWKKDGLPTESGEEGNVIGATFQAVYNPELFRDFNFMKVNIQDGTGVQVVDARPFGRFQGIEPEPRPDIPSGHIPKSVSAPFFGCFDCQNNIMLSKEKVMDYLKAKKVDVNKELVVSCGSGITASVLSFAMFYACGIKAPLFDGSWFEWQLNTPNDDAWQIREKVG